jgi:ferredoxin
VIEFVDLTPPKARIREFEEISDELAIIGSPVYNGRIPTEAIDRLQRIRGNNVPAVVVVVYGNRAYEDALLELRDLVTESGFKPIAAGSFIGEHSYSNSAMPIAAGRPDRDDLKKANQFGKTVLEKLRKMRKPSEVSPIRVPGNFPYKGRGGLSNISPVTRQTDCTKCEECAVVCPTAAITVGDTVVTDPAICIRCCACVKICSTGARIMEDPRIKQVVEQLSLNCRSRKEPEIYL